MSLIGVMKLLGHRSFRMTLRYAAITDQTVGREFEEALQHIQRRYHLPAAPATGAADTEMDPVKVLDDMGRWLKKRVQGGPLPPHLRALLKRIRRLQDHLHHLFPTST
jgi:hypothetical protein